MSQKIKETTVNKISANRVVARHTQPLMHLSLPFRSKHKIRFEHERMEMVATGCNPWSTLWLLWSYYLDGLKLLHAFVHQHVASSGMIKG